VNAPQENDFALSLTRHFEKHSIGYQQKKAGGMNPGFQMLTGKKSCIRIQHGIDIEALCGGRAKAKTPLLS
jgi:hypothetical protein